MQSSEMETNIAEFQAFWDFSISRIKNLIAGSAKYQIAQSHHSSYLSAWLT